MFVFRIYDIQGAKQLHCYKGSLSEEGNLIKVTHIYFLYLFSSTVFFLNKYFRSGVRYGVTVTIRVTIRGLKNFLRNVACITTLGYCFAYCAWCSYLLHLFLGLFHVLLFESDNIFITTEIYITTNVKA